MKRFVLAACLFFFSLQLQGCLTHWLLDGEVRLQLENRSQVDVTNLAVLGQDGARALWIVDTLAPGEKSEVRTDDWVGTFRLGLSVRDSLDAKGDSCWRQVELGTFGLDGGSSLARVRLNGAQWSLELK